MPYTTEEFSASQLAGLVLRDHLADTSPLAKSFMGASDLPAAIAALDLQTLSLPASLPMVSSATGIPDVTTYVDFLGKLVNVQADNIDVTQTADFTIPFVQTLVNRPFEGNIQLTGVTGLPDGQGTNPGYSHAWGLALVCGAGGGNVSFNMTNFFNIYGLPLDTPTTPGKVGFYGLVHFYGMPKVGITKLAEI